MNYRSETSIRENSARLESIAAPLACRYVVLFVLASEEYVVESGLRSPCEDFVESRVTVEIVKLANRLFDEASALDLDDASETRRHEVEV